MIAALFFSSCRGDEGPMGPMGPAGPAGQNGHIGVDGQDGKDGAGLQFLRYDFTVFKEDWEVIGGDIEKCFKCHFDFKELTADLCDIAIINAYYMWDEDGTTYQSALPTVRHRGDLSLRFTTTIDYDYAPGKLNFYVTNSDFYVAEPPETMVFRVVVYYPN